MGSHIEVEIARRKMIEQAKELGYGPSVIERLINATSVYQMKEVMVCGLNEFRTYKREAIVAVKDFGYGDDILEKVKKAETMRDVTIIMNEARRYSEFETEESVEAYDLRIEKESKSGKIR